MEIMKSNKAKLDDLKLGGALFVAVLALMQVARLAVLALMQVARFIITSTL
jgi:hypothetical protein